MGFTDKLYRVAARFYGKKLQAGYEKLLQYSPIRIEYTKFLGFNLTFGIVLGLAIAFLLGGLFALPFVIVFLLSVIIYQFIVYSFLLLYADIKARIVEEILPDALLLIASNLRAGLTVESAILEASRAEFGPLQNEISIVGRKIATGEDLGNALVEMRLRIRSKILEKSMLLIRSGLYSGGELAALLEQTAEYLRDQQLIQKRISSNVLTYVIFIGAAIGVGAPTLFALSSFLVEVISTTLGSIDIPETTVSAQIPINISVLGVSIGFIINYIMIFLVLNSVLGSIILGLINKGQERAGLKYIPLFIGLSMGVFFLVRFIIKTSFAELFGL